MRRRMSLLVLAIAVATVLGAAALAFGAIPGPDGTVSACVTPNESVRIIDAGGQCRSDPAGGAAEQLVTWNVKGVKGDTGAPGPQGLQGTAGPAGPAGAAPLPVGADDAFIDVDGISGESADAKHPGSITVLAWSFGAQSAAGSKGSGASVGKAQPGRLTFTHAFDKASPALFLACATGKHIKSATLFVRRRADKFEYLKVRLEDVLVSSVDHGTGNAASYGTVDAVSLSFAKVKIEYTAQKPDGGAGAKTVTGWNLKENKKA